MSFSGCRINKYCGHCYPALRMWPPLLYPKPLSYCTYCTPDLYRGMYFCVARLWASDVLWFPRMWRHASADGQLGAKKRRAGQRTNNTDEDYRIQSREILCVRECMQSIRGDKGGQYSGADVRMGGGDLDAATDAWPHIRRSLLLRDSSYLPQSQKYLPHS